MAAEAADAEARICAEAAASVNGEAGPGAAPIPA